MTEKQLASYIKTMINSGKSSSYISSYVVRKIRRRITDRDIKISKLNCKILSMNKQLQIAKSLAFHDLPF